MGQSKTGEARGAGSDRTCLVVSWRCRLQETDRLEGAGVGAANCYSMQKSSLHALSLEASMRKRLLEESY